MENEEERLGKRELSVARRNREAEDRNTTQNRGMDDRAATEDRAISEQERLEMFRLQNYQNVLPDIPEIPGWHVCWLTTTSNTDTIQRRSRLGYEPVRIEDVPGYGLEHSVMKTGEYQGLIAVKEMVAYKLPDNLYQMYMAESHHYQPLNEEQGIVDKLDSYHEQAERDGGRIVEDEGFKAMREAAPRLKRFA